MESSSRFVSRVYKSSLRPVILVGKSLAMSCLLFGTWWIVFDTVSGLEALWALLSYVTGLFQHLKHVTDHHYQRCKSLDSRESLSMSYVSLVIQISSFRLLTEDGSSEYQMFLQSRCVVSREFRETMYIEMEAGRCFTLPPMFSCIFYCTFPGFAARY